MTPIIPASPSGTLILQDREGVPVQYSLEGIEATFCGGWGSDDRVDLSARLAGGNFVDLDGNSDELLGLLLELYGEQARLGASDEALATTRHRIREHVKKETA